MVNKEEVAKKYIEVNAVLGELEKKREEFILKFTPDDKDSDELKLAKTIYLEDVPNLSGLIDYLDLYGGFFKKYIKLNESVILLLDGKKTRGEEKKPPQNDGVVEEIEEDIEDEYE